ncbi:MAG TPA: class I SAM-dependent methyltransferase [Anseongella sp.]
MISVNTALKNAYDNQYNHSASEWRRLTALPKARNIVNLTAGKNPSKMLEVGCGEGSILSWLDQWNYCPEIHAVDISDSGIRETSGKKLTHLVSAQVFDGYTLPFPDDYFDVACCAHVIEHVEFPRILMREIQRVSKLQYYEVPIDFSFYVDRKTAHYFAYGHINIYTPALFRFLLKTEGHTVLRELCGHHDKDTVRLLFKDNPMGGFKFKLKRLLFRTIPWFRGIKPDFYSVLTERNTETAGEAFDRQIQDLQTKE